MNGNGEVVRKWVSAIGGSCDVRYGRGAVETCGKMIASAMGKPRATALVHADCVGPDLVERLRRQLTDGGYAVHMIGVGSGHSTRTMGAVSELLEDLAGEGITADDVVLSVGDVDMLSATSFAAGLWCGRTPLVSVPLDLDAMVEVAVTPRGIDVSGVEGGVRYGTFSKMVVCDPEVMDMDVDAEPSRLARAIMVATAMAENEKSFSSLWDRAPQVMAGDEDEVLEVATECLKSRGHIASSTALSVKRSIAYGTTFARVLGRLSDHEVPASTRLGEALRFAARVSCSMGKLEVDDMLAQDELLDTFGIGEFEGRLDPRELFDALKAERFSRANRFHLCLPQAIGRVRPSTVDDDVLMENLAAWCEAHVPAE